jgi:stage II sporulation protein D
MLRLFALFTTLIFALPTQASTVRVRLAKSTKQIRVSGSFVCGSRSIKSPLAKRVGSRLMVAAKPVAKNLCSGTGHFVYNGLTWDGGAELRMHGNSLILVGVVAAELLPGWPLESLKAMAVAARSYTLWRIGQSSKAPYHLTADVSSQVFRGLNRIPAPVRQATQATRAQVLRYKRKPVAAYYHACAAGRTASASEVWGKDQPYLKSVISPDLACNRINWRTAMHVKDVGKRLGIGAISSVRIIGFTPSNRVDEVEFVSGETTRIVSGQKLRKKLGWAVLRSTDFSIAITGRQLVVLGHGSGHGVGMSQWGAKGMAQRGKDYRAILSHFYPGTELH